MLTHETSPLPTDFVDADQAARILRISKWTIYQWMKRGYIPYYKLGRLLRIRRADLATRIEHERRTGGIPWNFVPGT